MLPSADRPTHQGPDHKPPVRDEDALGIREYVVVLWQARWLIAAVAVAFAVAGASWSLLTRRTYEASVTVSVSQSRLADQPLDRLDPIGFANLLGAQAVADKVVRDLELSKPPLNLTATSLMDRVMTIRVVPSSSLIKVVARLEDPALAARVANAFAQEGIQLARQTSRGEVGSAEQEMKTMLDAATERLHEAEQLYDEFRKVAQIELVRKEVDTLLIQRTDLMKTVVELETERAKLARAEQELASRNRVNVVHESIDRSPAMLEAARGEKVDPAGLLSLRLQSEVVNPVFSNIDLDVAEFRTRVATLERQREQLLRATGGSAAQIERLSEMYRRESRLDQLDAERRIARKTYEDVASRYQGAKLMALARTPQLLIVDPALVPDRPERRYVARNALLGLVVGALLGGMIAILRGLVDSQRMAQAERRA